MKFASLKITSGEITWIYQFVKRIAKINPVVGKFCFYYEGKYKIVNQKKW